MRIEPSEFQPDQGWLISRIPNSFVVGAQTLDIYVLVDIGSGCILDQMTCAQTLPSVKQLKAMFKRARKARKKYADIIYLPKGDPAIKSLESVAKSLKSEYEIIPTSYMDKLTAPIAASLNKFSAGNSSTDLTAEDIESFGQTVKMIPDAYDFCSCGSLKKYKFCCKPIFHKIVDAMVAAEDGFFSEATRFLKEAEEIVGLTPEILCRYSIIYAFKGDKAKAKEYLDKTFASNPNHPRAHYLQAMEYRDQGKLELAEKSYLRAIENYPKTDRYHLNETYNNLANVYYDLKKFRTAKETWEKALILYPEDELTARNLSKRIYENESLSLEDRRPSDFAKKAMAKHHPNIKDHLNDSEQSDLDNSGTFTESVPSLKEIYEGIIRKNFRKPLSKAENTFALLIASGFFQGSIRDFQAEMEGEEEFEGLLESVLRLKQVFSSNFSSKDPFLNAPIFETVNDSKLEIFKIPDTSEKSKFLSKEQIDKVATKIDPDLESSISGSINIPASEQYICIDAYGLREEKGQTLITRSFHGDMPFRNGYTFGLKLDIGDSAAADISIHRFVFGESFAELLCDYFKTLESEKQIEELTLSLLESEDLELFVQCLPAIWKRLFDTISNMLYQSDIRYSSKRAATMIVDDICEELEENPELKNFFLFAVSTPDNQDKLLSAVEEGKVLTGMNYPYVSTGLQIVGALIENLSPRTLSSFKKRHKSSKGKKKTRLKYRLQRSNLNVANIKDHEFALFASKLENEMRGELKDRGINLKVPGVEFSRSSNSEGIVDFDLDSQTLSLCVTFINAPWQQLKNICKWALTLSLSQHYKKANSLSSNEAFKLAADRFNLVAQFRNFSDSKISKVPDLWVDAEDALNEKQKRTLEKVSKLFSLAGSDNEAEASLAMQRAQELLNRQQLDEYSSQNPDASQIVQLSLYLDTVEANPIDRKIVNILSSYYSVRIIYSYYFHLEKKKYLAAVLLIGRKPNVLMAEHIFDFLQYQVHSLWESRKKLDKMNIRDRYSFQLGILQGFSEKLEEIKLRQQMEETKSGKENSLVVLQNIETDEFVEKEFPDLSHSSGRKRTEVNADVYSKGTEAGKSLNVNVPVERGGSDGSGGLLSK